MQHPVVRQSLERLSAYYSYHLAPFGFWSQARRRPELRWRATAVAVISLFGALFALSGVVGLLRVYTEVPISATLMLVALALPLFVSVVLPLEASGRFYALCRALATVAVWAAIGALYVDTAAERDPLIGATLLSLISRQMLAGARRLLIAPLAAAAIEDEMDAMRATLAELATRNADRDAAHEGNTEEPPTR